MLPNNTSAALIENTVKICRICLSFDDSMKFVDCLPYADYFEEIARLDVSWCSNNVLCVSCAYRVNSTIKLKKQTLEADILLRISYKTIQNGEHISLDDVITKRHTLNPTILSTYPPFCLDIDDTCKSEGLGRDDEDLLESHFEIFVPQIKEVYKTDTFSYDENASNADFSDDEDCTISQLILKSGRKPSLKTRTARKKSPRESRLENGRKTGMGDYDDKIEVVSLSKKEQLAELKEQAMKESYQSSLFKCEYCFIGFGFQETYNGHMMKHDKAKGDLECDVCHCVFNSPRSLDSHTRYVHGKRYRCTECAFTRATKMLVVEHYRTEHDQGDKKPFVCVTCKQVFPKYSALRRHAWREHNSRKLPCSQCGKLLANSSSLRAHITSVHSKEKPFTCDKCNKRFATRTHLTVHAAMHSTLRQFYCAQCDVSFKSASTFRGHLRSTMKHLNKDTFRQCLQCPKLFPNGFLLDIHVHKVHMNVKRFPCDMCPKSFFSASALSHHKRRAHDGQKYEKKYICELCGRGFAAKKTLQSHINVHTGARPYKCKLCEASFGHDASLYTHHRLVHLKMKKKPRKKKQLDAQFEPNVTI